MPEIYLSVIIPAFNEEKRLPSTLEDIDGYLSKQDYSYEIIVESDGSKDRTVEVTKELMSEIKNLRILDFKQNRGKGYGVREGMLEAKGEYRLFADADNSTPISEVEKMWPYFKEGYDIVIGSRDVKGAILDPPQPLFRRFVGEGFSLFRKIIIGLWEVKDSQCGFKVFSKKAAEEIFPKCKIDRFAFDPEILIIGKKFGYKIKEVPIYWKNDLESKVKFKSMIKMAADLFKIRFNLLKGVYDTRS